MLDCAAGHLARGVRDSRRGRRVRAARRRDRAGPDRHGRPAPAHPMVHHRPAPRRTAAAHGCAPGQHPPPPAPNHPAPHPQARNPVALHHPHHPHHQGTPPPAPGPGNTCAVCGPAHPDRPRPLWPPAHRDRIPAQPRPPPPGPPGAPPPAAVSPPPAATLDHTLAWDGAGSPANATSPHRANDNDTHCPPGSKKEPTCTRTRTTTASSLMRARSRSATPAASRKSRATASSGRG
jgi:hypothetical protein